MTIVYTSESGFTKSYAQTLGQSTGIPVYSLDEAKQKLSQNEGIFYMSWMRAGQLKDYNKAKSAFQMQGCCGVGIRPDTENVLPSLIKGTKLSASDVFYFPGGYAPDNLSGGTKVALELVLSMIRKKIKSQKNISPQEEHLLDVCTHGGSFADRIDLAPLEAWLTSHKKP